MKKAKVYISEREDGHYFLSATAYAPTGDLTQVDDHLKQAAIEATNQTMASFIAQVTDAVQALMPGIALDFRRDNIKHDYERKPRTDGKDVVTCAATAACTIESMDHAAIIAGSVTTILTAKRFTRVEVFFFPYEKSPPPERPFV